MTGEGFPFDLVLIALIAGILGGVGRAKRERKEQDDRVAEERRKDRLKREMEAE
ncbi:MAG: hypothetical protein NWR72_14875 [Bacteroidia bacterium]|nr:hypothetical protein [Bacteroidia bacterium]